jgi:hypothetical protein
MLLGKPTSAAANGLPSCSTHRASPQAACAHSPFNRSLNLLDLLLVITS